MKKYLFLYSLVLFAVVISCRQKTENDVEKDYLISLVEKFPPPAGTEWFILLPGMGCHGCIQEAEAFMKDFVDKKNMYFVLTRVESLKILEHKIGAKVSGQSNVRADIENEIKIPTPNIVYPCIVKIKDGRYQEHAFQSPNSPSAFNNLRLLLEE
ncbi:hypothetical protein [Olivibacter sitiensis]|uniref:hypothetical protein n=1 Tax=Olivibacter sitiensis TaxID=376470 RepID=UPI0004824CC7|nr:hypothetical protein [Olivibacter sitiensis]